MIRKLLQHNVLKNTLALGGVQVANYIVPLLAWPLLAKKLGLEQFGTFMLILAICTVAYILTDFGFNLSATHMIAQKTQDKTYIGQLLGNIFCIKFFFAIFASIIAILYAYFQLLPATEHYLSRWSLVLIVCIIFAQAFHCIWFFQGIEKMQQMTKVTIISKVGYVILLFIIFQYVQSIEVALFCFLLSQLCITLLYVIYIYKEEYFISSPKIDMIIQEIKYSFNFFISRVAVSLYTVANTLLIGHISGSAAAGLYSSAEKIYGAGTGMVGIVSQALFPYATRIQNLKLLFKIIFLLSIPVFIGCFILSQFAEEIIVIIFGTAFIDAAELLQIFLGMLCISFLSMSFGYPAFSAIQKVQWANYTVMIGGLFHIIGLSILYIMNYINAHTILYMTMITEVLIFMLRLGLLFFFYKRG